MDTERLQAFRAVAREQSFSRAADRLFKTQPAVSQAVGSLERELGERLFVRQGRRTTLTQAGRVLLEHVEQAFDALDQARLRLDALKELREGVLTVSASDTTACYVLPDALRAFRERYPGVEVRILNRPSPVAAEQVAARDADLAVVTLPVAHAGLASEPLTVREDVAICAPQHPLAGRERVRLAELLAYPLLLLDRGSNTRSFIDEQLAETGVAPRVAMELGSIEVIKKLVSLDFGVSIVPRIAVRDEVARGDLWAVRVFEQAECRRLGLVYPRKGLLPRAAQVFMQMLREHVPQDRAL
ncbi:MAG: LysR family transcriptional regulator [Candidatus Hydrogenedentes bacterium]|nr:LysR family transcriptional regulator [Candidatus Hydrogenedentota bacterium]